MIKSPASEILNKKLIFFSYYSSLNCIIYACNLTKLMDVYAVFAKNNTEVFLFAQFLRRVPSFAAMCQGAEIWRGGSKAPPPHPPVIGSSK